MKNGVWCAGVALFGTAFVMSFAACGGKPAASGNVAIGTPSATPPPNGSAPPPNGSVAPQPTGSAPPAASGSAPIGNVFTTDPNQLAQLFAAAAAAGQAMLTPMGAGDPVEIGIKASAAKNAPGMTAEGNMAKGQLQEGGHLQFLVNMQGGKCYTIVGFSPPGGVQDLDLNVLAPPLYTMLAGQDGTSHNMPVVGGSPKPLCPLIPLSVPYKIDIYAKKGSGPVGGLMGSRSV